jgi:fatty acyl-CoA reductase
MDDFPFLDDVLWYPSIKMRKSALATQASIFITQTIPAHIGDLALRVAGKKPRLVKTQEFVYRAYSDVTFAANSSIHFRSDNPDKIASAMTKSDLREFDFDVRKINWRQFVDDYHIGMRKYLSNDWVENYPALRRRVVG